MIGELIVGGSKQTLNNDDGIVIERIVVRGDRKCRPVRRALNLLQETLAIRERGTEVPDPDATKAFLEASGADTQDKWTEGCCYCVASAVMGLPLDQGTPPTSVLLHATPGAFMHSAHSNDRPIGEYAELLANLLSKQGGEKFVAVIAGGLVPTNRESDVVYLAAAQARYNSAIDMLAKLHQDYLGITTTVVPPKNKRGKTNVYLDSTNRKFNIVEVIPSWSLRIRS